MSLDIRKMFQIGNLKYLVMSEMCGNSFISVLYFFFSGLPTILVSSSLTLAAEQQSETNSTSLYSPTGLMYIIARLPPPQVVLYNGILHAVY